MGSAERVGEGEVSAFVEVKLPSELVWDLWKRAESKDVKVADVIREALRVADSPPVRVVAPTVDVTHERVRALVADGWDDGQIAVQIGRVRAYVATVRRRYGLPPNSRKKVPA